MGPCATSISEHVEMHVVGSTREGRATALPAPLLEDEVLVGDAFAGGVPRVLLLAHIASASIQTMGTPSAHLTEEAGRFESVPGCGRTPYAPILPGTYRTHPVVVGGEVIGEPLDATIEVPEDRKEITFVVGTTRVRYRVTCTRYEGDGTSCPQPAPVAQPAPVTRSGRGCAVAPEPAPPGLWALALIVGCLCRAGRTRRD